MRDADAMLAEFLQATEEVERERLLEALITAHAVPIIRQTIKLRMHSYITANGQAADPDVEDVCQNALTNLMLWLRKIHAEPEAVRIERLEFYLQRVAVNAHKTHLRKATIVRYRILNKLRDLLARQSEFAMWRGKRKAILCGYADWAGRKSGSKASDKDQIMESLDEFRSGRLAGQDPNQLSLARLVAEIFAWVDEPLELDSLAEIVARLQSAEELFVALPEDEELQVAAPPSSATQIVLEERESLLAAWAEVIRLPREQRLSFCLGEKGDQVWSLLVEVGAMTPAQIARDLGISSEELFKLWLQVPLEIEAIAEYLQATNSQVSKWRLRALKNLKKRLSHQ